tara:strand:- start:3174 stop:3452 length:279 start_codon:yes stop_codon:yes gene_type:complete
MDFVSIIEGNLRSVLGLKTPIMIYREEEYCKKCPVALNDLGEYNGRCNKDNGGCNCGVSAKTAQNGIDCPKGFWGSDWFKPELFKEYLQKIK